ncbi:Monogalactosyldiacylglycerol synthase [Forsythia ovata]|uniref:Monogalactosyldiacylglycerol synthase n=1 Tax=Forsythia ovata TaxID=205694 RepID=A0ABD1X9K0_9LAMI
MVPGETVSEIQFSSAISRSMKNSTAGKDLTSSVLNQFNRAIKFHCERIPLSFFEDQVNSEENNGFSNDGRGFLEDSKRVPVNGDSESPNKVLILISDTGGGHRASPEAIKVAFREEYGCSTSGKSIVRRPFTEKFLARDCANNGLQSLNSSTTSTGVRWRYCPAVEN